MKFRFDLKGFASLTLLLIVILIIALGIIFVMYFNVVQKKTPQTILSLITRFYKSFSEKELKTATFYKNNLADRETIINYADGNVLYKYKLDGGFPEEITQFDNNIVAVQVVPFTKDLFIQTLKPGPSKYSNLFEEWQGWSMKNGSLKAELLYQYTVENSPKAIPTPHPVTKKRQLVTTNEYIFAEKEGAGLNIMADALDGSLPKKIGFLAQPLIKLPCEDGRCPQQAINLIGVVPSYDGKYLLDESPKGFGRVIIVSRDGTKIYALDRHISQVVWISGDQLLACGQKGQKIITLKPEGDLTTVDVPSSTQCQLIQNYLSPSKEYFIQYGGGIKLELLSLKDKSTILIDQIDDKVFKTENRIPPETIVSNFGILGWNHTSDKFLYGEFVRRLNPEGDDYFYKKEIKIFDLKAQKSYKVADLKPDNKMWVDLSFFAIQ